MKYFVQIIIFVLVYIASPTKVTEGFANQVAYNDHNNNLHEILHKYNFWLEFICEFIKMRVYELSVAK